MTRQVFHDKVAAILEVDHVDDSTEFRKLDGWCSLQAFGLMVLLENGLGVRLDMDAFSRLNTVGDLYAAGS